MPAFPTLAFVPVESLLRHEQHDDQRTHPLVLRIRAAGVWRNPPIVCPLPDGSGRAMVLDGANRVAALQAMGFPHALVQVTLPDDPGLSLQTWNHVVWELNPQRFLTGLRAIQGIELLPTPGSPVTPQLDGDCHLALIETPEGLIYSVCTAEVGLEQRIALLNALVSSYLSRARLDRTRERSLGPLRDLYPGLSGLVIFPAFTLDDLLRLVGEKVLLPPGVTCFTISPRALHLNYPLEELAADRSLEDKNTALHQWVRDRLAHKNVRYYAEATVLFDE